MSAAATRPGTHGALGRLAAVRLVAWREITTRVATRAFRITTAVMVLSVVALTAVAHYAGGLGSSATTVALVPPVSSLGAPLTAAASAVGEDITTRTVAGETQGEALLRDSSVDVLVTGSPQSPAVVVRRDLAPGLQDALTLVVRQRALDSEITALGGDPNRVQQGLAQATVQVRSLEPPDPTQAQRIALGFVVGIFIYLALLTYGQVVAQGVVEEKTTRVVELLLATLRPWQLMAGKVLGIGAVGLAQLTLVGAVGAVAAHVSGVLTISLTATVGAVAWAVLWFLLGFTIYAMLFAAAGALVSRQEDVGTVTVPMLMLIIAPYVVGVSVLPGDPESSLAAVLSIIPFFAPMLMPWRIALDVAAPWEIGLAVLLALAVLPLLVWFAGRIYRNAVVRTGARVGLREALRSA